MNTNGNSARSEETAIERIAALQLSLKVTWTENERVSILFALIKCLSLREIPNVEDHKLASLYTYELLALMPSEDPRRPTVVTGLVGIFATIVSGSPKLEDIDEGLTIGEEALQLLRPCHGVEARLCLLSSLGCLHMARYRIGEAHDDFDDLNQAIAFAEMAVQTRRKDVRAVIMVLQSLLVRYSRFGDYQDVELAVRFGESAIDNRLQDYRVLANLCKALEARYQFTKIHSDLDEVIYRLEQLIQQTHIPHNAREYFKSQLAISKDLHS
ncbi:hypothetical protein ACHAPU_006261 [Fusarium lateritium]